jgi:hypothetical protein
MLFDSGQQYSGRAFRDCLHEAVTHSVQIVRPQRGYRWSDDGITLEILAPSLPLLADTGDDINDMLHYNNFRDSSWAMRESQAKRAFSPAGPISTPTSERPESRPSRLTICLNATLYRGRSSARRSYLSRTSWVLRD